MDRKNSKKSISFHPSASGERVAGETFDGRKVSVTYLDGAFPCEKRKTPTSNKCRRGHTQKPVDVDGLPPSEGFVWWRDVRLNVARTRRSVDTPPWKNTSARVTRFDDSATNTHTHAPSVDKNRVNLKEIKNFSVWTETSFQTTDNMLNIDCYLGRRLFFIF